LAPGGLAIIGPLIEWLLRFVYERDEAFQLLLTFALVLMFEDIMRLIWGNLSSVNRALYLSMGS
jgi:branched-chain amino acid transport system permease protein